MATESKGKTIKVELHEEIVNDLEKRAESMSFFTEEYCSAVLTNWLKSGQTLTITEE